MDKLKIFLAAPISGFQDECKYVTYRKNVLMLISLLLDKYDVRSEIQNISEVKTYDTPEESLKKDFNEIEKSDIFLLLHPMRMQTSSLIELGYACALKKKLLIVGKKEDLPYLVHGLVRPTYNALSIYTSEINCEVITSIIDALSTLNNMNN